MRKSFVQDPVRTLSSFLASRSLDAKEDVVLQAIDIIEAHREGGKYTKDAARKLSIYLKKYDIDLRYQAALDAIAVLEGRRSWNVPSPTKGACLPEKDERQFMLMPIASYLARRDKGIYVRRQEGAHLYAYKNYMVIRQWDRVVESWFMTLFKVELSERGEPYSKAISVREATPFAECRSDDGLYPDMRVLWKASEGRNSMTFVDKHGAVEVEDMYEEVRIHDKTVCHGFWVKLPGNMTMRQIEDYIARVGLGDKLIEHCR